MTMFRSRSTNHCPASLAAALLLALVSPLAEARFQATEPPAAVPPTPAAPQEPRPPTQARPPAGAPLLIPRKPAETPLPEIPLTPLEKYEVRGSGKTSLILIPDQGMDWRLWDPFMERNASRYTMYAINLPGMGGTTIPAPMPDDAFFSDGVWTRNAERAILALMDEKKLDKAFVMGQSYGGHLAIRLAILHPDRIAGAMSLDGTVTIELPDQNSPRMPRESREGFVAETIRAGKRLPDAKFLERQIDGLKRSVASEERGNLLASMLDGTTKEAFLQYMGEYYAADLWPLIADLKSPIAVLVTIPEETNDNRGLPRAQKDKWSKWFRAAKTNCDLVFIENTLPIITESAPYELDRAIHAFIAGNYVSGKSRFSKPMTSYVAPEEGGPAETPRPATDPTRAPEAPKPEADKSELKAPAAAPEGTPTPK